MGGFKRIRDMSEDLSNESEERLRELLAYWQMMAEICALIHRPKRQQKHERRARRAERALKLKQAKGNAAEH